MGISVIILILLVVIVLFCYGVYVIVHSSNKEKDTEEISKIATSGKYAVALQPITEALNEKKPSCIEIKEWLDSQNIDDKSKDELLKNWKKSINDVMQIVDEGDLNGVTTYRIVIGEKDRKICSFLHEDNFITRNQISQSAEILPPYCLGSDSMIVPKLPWDQNETKIWKSIVPKNNGNYDVPNWKQIL